MSASWRNRIVGYGEEAPDQLLANPLAYRIHPAYQQEMMREIFCTIGWVRGVLVNQRTGYMIDGHMSVRLAMQDNIASVPVCYVDLSENEERRMVAVMDRIGAMARTKTRR